jgi:hypothetical protein
MAPVTRPLILAGLLAIYAFAQRRPPQPFPPDIVPPEITQWRDPLRIDPVHYKLDLENEQVRVLRLKLKGEEAVPMHDDKDALFVSLTECHLRLTRPDGRVQDVHLEPGKTRWILGDSRSAKNLSTQPLEILIIETKTKPGSN